MARETVSVISWNSPKGDRAERETSDTLSDVRIRQPCARKIPVTTSYALRRNSVGRTGTTPAAPVTTATDPCPSSASGGLRQPVFEMAVGRWHRRDRPLPSLQQTLAGQQTLVGAAGQGRKYSADVGKFYPVLTCRRQYVTSYAGAIGKTCLVRKNFNDASPY